MRGVADTNTVLSGLLWHGPPRQVLEAARRGELRLFTTAELLAELEDVLGRAKLSHRLQVAGVTAQELVRDYAALAVLVQPAVIAGVIADDPDDDAVLAAAVAAQAEVIVSGDNHLLTLQEFQGIKIVRAPDILERLPSEPEAGTS